MKKFILAILSALMCVAFAVGICACNPTPEGSNSGGNDGEETPLTFTGVALNDATVVFDGAPHSLSVTGNFPADTQIIYENNSKIDVGVYSVKAKLQKSGYVDKELTATLTINRAEFSSDIALKDAEYFHTGKTFALAVDGDLPAGTQVSYTNNDKKDVGVYEVTAKLENSNYITKQLKAKLTIKSITEAVFSIINNLLEKPDPWSFLPEALLPERMAYEQMPVSGLDGFSTSISVSRIANRSIGKQFHVLYEGLDSAAFLMGKIDALYTVGATIADVYQNFINKNPDNYAQFVGEAGGFKVKILLDGEKSTMLAGNSAVSLELIYDAQTQIREGRIQLTDGAAIKYVSTPNSLKFAVKMTMSSVGNLKQIEFVRNGNAVAGYLREFTGTESKNLKTTGTIMSNARTTVIMSDKRESDDLAIEGYEEVYSSVTGEMIGGEVLETIELVNYDTLWLPLNSVQGFTDVRIEDKKNGRNLHSIYVNGQSTVFATKRVTPINPLSSRRFDIEMKDVWYVVKGKTDGSKTEYSLQKTLIPMLCVQREQINSFPADVKETNPYISSAVLPSDNITKVGEYFNTMKTLYDTAKESVNYNDIVVYIGNKDEFFNA